MVDGRLPTENGGHSDSDGSVHMTACLLALAAFAPVDSTGAPTQPRAIRRTVFGGREV